MVKRNTFILLQCAVLAVVLIAMVEEAVSFTECGIDLNDLKKCQKSVTGDHPSPPDHDCCDVLKKADLECLCTFKSYLPDLGIDPANALALPKKCRLNDIPECIGKHI